MRMKHCVLHILGVAVLCCGYAMAVDIDPKIGADIDGFIKCNIIEKGSGSWAELRQKAEKFVSQYKDRKVFYQQFVLYARYGI